MLFNLLAAFFRACFVCNVTSLGKKENLHCCIEKEHQRSPSGVAFLKLVAGATRRKIQPTHLLDSTNKIYWVILQYLGYYLFYWNSNLWVVIDYWRKCKWMAFIMQKYWICLITKRLKKKDDDIDCLWNWIAQVFSPPFLHSIGFCYRYCVLRLRLKKGHLNWRWKSVGYLADVRNENKIWLPKKVIWSRYTIIIPVVKENGTWEA